jgi:hypothetical protein
MRFIKLIIGDKEYKKNSEIVSHLEKNDLGWLLSQQVDDATIEIKNKTLIWHDGYFLGDWYYGIFKKGEFHGRFLNGIFENGQMRGKFISGIKLQEL